MDYATEQLLISEIQANNILWNKTDSQYKNGRQKGKIWDSIAEKLRYKKETLKNKWLSLKNKYFHEKNLESMCRSGDSADDSYTSNWPHYQFLSDSTADLDPRSNLDKLFDPNFDVSEDDFQGTAPAYKAKSKPKKALKPKFCSTKKNQEMEKGNPQIIDKTRRDSLVESSQNVRNVLDNYLSDMSDDDILFFKTLASYVKKISRERILKFRNEVNNIVDKYAYEDKSKGGRQIYDSDNDDDCIIMSDSTTKKINVQGIHNIAIKKEKHVEPINCGTIKREPDFQPNPCFMTDKENYSEPNRCGTIKQEKDVPPFEYGINQQGYGPPLFGYNQNQSMQQHIPGQRYWDMMKYYQSQQHPFLLPVPYVEDRP